MEDETGKMLFDIQVNTLWKPMHLNQTLIVHFDGW